VCIPPDFTARLADHAPPSPKGDPPTRRAAVAALLRPGEDGLQVLLMRRAAHPQDPWSGHVSLPGGGHEEHDDDLLATAVRETHEEVGVGLHASAHLLCQLEPVIAVGRGRVLPMDITPFVFLASEPVQAGLSEEAVETFWLPLGPAVAGEFDGQHIWHQRGTPHESPCWTYEGRTIWGLTYRMLRRMLTAGGVSAR
jgi:8-oxo-dGTP pyrophosphatase MutT (NUDIX family)